jgi:hypothetical protein
LSLNKEIDKDQLSFSNQQEMESNFFIPSKKLRYVSSYPSKLIIGNFEGTKTIASLRNISEHYAFVSYI